MLADRTVQFADEVLDLIDDFVPGVKTRIIAEQLVRSATSTAANYRAAQRARSRAEFSSKMFIVTFSSRRTAQTGATSYHRVKR